MAVVSQGLIRDNFPGTQGVIPRRDGPYGVSERWQGLISVGTSWPKTRAQQLLRKLGPRQGLEKEASEGSTQAAETGGFSD